MVRRSLAGATDSACDMLKFAPHLSDARDILLSGLIGFVTGLATGYLMCMAIT